jgi:soluble lytic murein transglycosylase
MRQESRFVMDARSAVGAKGLMQLMPATARWVARKIGLEGYHPQRVSEMDTNVTLGTSYLKMVLDSLDKQPLLASAAYNAGPGRARQWRADHALEGAIYAETIPFAETRDYVKRVMSNAVYYAALFEGKPQSLKSRLGTVRPRGFGDAVTEDLP